MKLLITGSSGFVGKNLIAELNKKKYDYIKRIYGFDIDSNIDLLDEYTKDCDFVIHLAGVNRPQDPTEFMEGNYGFTTTLLSKLKKNNNKSPILITSSIQAELDNPYGISKKAAEDYIFSYGKECSVKTLVYRLPNVFGKWCRPNYNSAIATFCNNIANDLSIQVNDAKHVLKLIYIDDLINEIISAIEDSENRIGDFCFVEPFYEKSLGYIVEKLFSFKELREKLHVPDMKNDFIRKLYSTYLSYLPSDKFSYPLKMNVDNRGSFTEFIRTDGQGQVSVNVSKPGITKGNHWHHSKNEKFLVVSGEGVIRFRNIYDNNVIEYFVSEKKLEVVDIPCGYTHNITNLGETNMVTLMWVNEPFDPDNPDTEFLEV